MNVCEKHVLWTMVDSYCDVDFILADSLSFSTFSIANIANANLVFRISVKTDFHIKWLMFFFFFLFYF